MKLNKIDSQQYRNFLIPEVDWLLNEAQELFIKMVAEPRLSFHLGFEKSQRNTDDIKMLVNEELIKPYQNAVIERIGYHCKYYKLPENYMFFIRALVYGKTRSCENVPCVIKIKQHDDSNHISPFDRSSVVWREINGMFIKDLLELELPDPKEEEGADLEDFYLTYIRQPAYIHFAQGVEDGKGYQLNSDPKSLLTGKQDCELSPHTHREIVDIAVMLASGQLQIQDPFKMTKLNLNQLNN
jgi:hypothetical protein